MNFNNNQQPPSEKKVVKDLPSMRSVVLRSSSSLDFPSPMARSAFREETKPTITTNNTIYSKGFSSPSSQQQLQLPSMESWKVLDHSVKEIPDLYPLERTNAAVANATAQQVMDRISNCLREHSIAATFDADKAAIQAETKEQIRFIIRLFFNHGKVIVEVQRRCGCAYVFHQCSDAVLCAAQGTQQRSPPPRSLPKFTIPDCVKAAAAAAQKESEEERERLWMESDLECAIQLWKSDRYDAQLLGMESLMRMTQPQQPQKAKLRAFCAHSLLCSKQTQDLLLESVYHTDDDDDNVDDFGDSMLATHLHLMRRHAMTVFANCLEALNDSNELAHVVQVNAKTLQSPKLLNTLSNALSLAEDEPHVAHEAARCLGPLCRACTICKEHAMDVGVPEAVSQALQVGMVRHALLEGSSRRLQMEMGFS